jgi:hypothetical protein
MVWIAAQSVVAFMEYELAVLLGYTLLLEVGRQFNIAITQKKYATRCA